MMRRWSLLLGVVSITTFGCAGATDTELDDDVDLPDEFDSVSDGLTAEVDPNHEASGDHDRECRDHDGKHKHGKRHHHLLKWLDRLDGEKDHRVVIANLPARVPQRLIEKLHTIDASGDGIVTKDEVRAAMKSHKASRKHDD